MSTWTMGQISQARGIRAKIRVDRMLIERAREDVLSATRKRMFRSMQDMAHSFAIELHPGDIRSRESDCERDAVDVLAWWEPQTDVVELRGGQGDGTVLAFPDAPHGTLMVAQQAPPLAYRCVGWHEQERRWVYST